LGGLDGRAGHQRTASPEHCKLQGAIEGSLTDKKIEGYARTSKKIVENINIRSHPVVAAVKNKKRASRGSDQQNATVKRIAQKKHRVNYFIAVATG